ncbi:hypothetical protein CCP4SC76_970002 [Gammaproteobacteria bacterium]
MIVFLLNSVGWRPWIPGPVSSLSGRYALYQYQVESLFPRFFLTKVILAESPAAKNLYHPKLQQASHTFTPLNTRLAFKSSTDFVGEGLVGSFWG